MNTDEILKSVQKNIEELTSKYKFSFDDPKGSTIKRVNDEGARLLRELTETRKVAIDKYRISVEDINYIYLLPFVPFIYPEANDNSYKELVCDYMRIGSIRFNGLPDQPDSSTGILHTGYKTELIFSEPVEASYCDIKVKFEPEFDPENPPEK